MTARQGRDLNGRLWRLPLILAAVTSLTYAAVLALAHWSPIIPSFVNREISRLQSTNGVYLYDAGFVDDADYVLLGQVPVDDRSQGGVYFIGDSELNVALQPWRLSPEERRLIHNYSMGALRHHDVRQLVQMLVEDFDLLRAGGDHTTIFLGLSYYLARPPVPGANLAYYVERHGLYSYDHDGGMHPVHLSRIERFFLTERDYAQRVLGIATALRRSRVWPPDPAAKTGESRRLSGDWRAAMREEVRELEALLDYLQEQGVRVVAILPPSGSWDDNLPYERAYRRLIEPVVRSHHVDVIDEGDLLSDEEFADGNHPTYAASMRLHQLHRQAALRALGEMGMSPLHN